MSSMTIKALLPSPRYTCHARRTVSCVTFAITCRIAFLRLLMSGRVWVKTWVWAPTNPCQLHEWTLHSPHVLCGVPFQHREILGPTFSRVMTVSLWQWTPNVITTCWKTFSYLRWDVATGIRRDRGFSRTVPQPIRHDSQRTPYVLHSPGESSLSVWWNSEALQSPDLTAADFLWGYLKSQIFTLSIPDINSLKNAIW
jgi:hypothetical protein